MNEFPEEEKLDEDKLKLLSVKIPNEHLMALDELLRKERYPTRSEAIRTAIRDLIKRHWGKY
ncbi:MAG: ribbon-helix-helix protein, CopG family [Candidatus Heimdallarchaeota archaeon]|nr:ribbon-helix-helix protein, CopG family [Candidatus Heimdallarchaeota archaeon]